MRMLPAAFAAIALFGAVAVGLPAEVSVVPFSTLLRYREPRQSKSILRLRDRRAVSAQRVPEYV